MKMKELFDRGEFVVSAEVGPPKGIHVDELVEEAKTYLKGVHAVNVTDNQSSVMRLGSLAMCKVLKDAGMDPIFQLACRDRNRIALESDLLSAAMFGIENILCLTGDHTKMGDHPQAKPVFDLDSVSLLHTVKLLESGVDLGGNELVGEPPKFSKGAVVSPCSDSVDAQLAKMERKVAAGSDNIRHTGHICTLMVSHPGNLVPGMYHRLRRPSCHPDIRQLSVHQHHRRIPEPDLLPGSYSYVS